MTDNFLEQECLELSGPDGLKDFWSKIGQWVGNHHNYCFGDLHRNVSYMIQLEEITINPDAGTVSMKIVTRGQTCLIILW